MRCKLADARELLLDMLYWRTPHAFPFSHGYLCSNSEAFTYLPFGTFNVCIGFIIFAVI